MGAVPASGAPAGRSCQARAPSAARAILACVEGGDRGRDRVPRDGAERSSRADRGGAGERRAAGSDTASASGEEPGRLAARLYAELKRIASRNARGRREGSLQPTDLVHEAYLRLALPEKRWQESAAFLGAAAKAMRSVLVDHARARGRLKRESPGRRVPLDELCASYAERAIDLLALDEALDELAEVDAPMAQAVELRFFVGLDAERTAEALGIPLRSFERRWATTRRWLHRRVR